MIGGSRGDGAMTSFLLCSGQCAVLSSGVRNRILQSQRIGSMVAIFASFGLGVAVVFSELWVAWLPVAVVVGVLLPRNRLLAWGGLTLSILAWVLLQGELVAEAPYEDTYGHRSIPRFLTAVGGAALAGPAVLIGARISRGLPHRLRTVASGAAAVMGVAGAVGVFATWGLLAAVPGTESSAVTLPDGWTILDREQTWWRTEGEPAYGQDFTAVRPERNVRLPTPPRYPGEEDEPTNLPVIGMSTVRVKAPTPTKCIGALDVWARPPTNFYDGDPIESGGVSLPAGPAYRTVRATDIMGSRLYTYAFARERRVGLVLEPLCYLVAVNVPVGAGISEQDVTALVQTFRFR